MVLDPTMFPTATDPDICVCGRLIPDSAVYYAFPLSPDNDALFAYINEWHTDCLNEWGWRRDTSEFGIAHVYCAEETDEEVRAA